MKLLIHRGPLDVGFEVDTLALGVFEGRAFESDLVREVDRLVEGLLVQALTDEGFIGGADEAVVVHTAGRPGFSPRRVLIVGLGTRDDFDVPETARYAARVGRRARGWGSTVVGIGVPPVDPVAHPRAARFVAQGLVAGAGRASLTEARVIVVGPADPITLARGRVVGEGVCVAQGLMEGSGGLTTSDRLVERAMTLARSPDITCSVLGRRECERKGLGLLLGVARGDTEEPRLIHLTLRPRGREKPSRRYALVSAGPCERGRRAFDPTRRSDGAGAAALLAALEVLPSLGVTAEVNVVIGVASDGGQGRPGEVLSGFGGRTVELAAADAAAQLVVADALGYAAALGPDEIIDVAPLGTATVSALGPDVASVVGNDQALVERFVGAARRIGEQAWHLPLPRGLARRLRSEVAEVKTAGAGPGQALLPGLFLRRFVGATPWIHVDISGPAFAAEGDTTGNGGPAGGYGGPTGYGVASIVEYITRRDGLS